MGFDAGELSKFTEAGVAISRAAGISFEQWAEGESAMILSGWAAFVNAQTVPQAELRARTRVLNKLGLTKGDVTINSGIRGPEGRVFIRAKNGKFMFAGLVGHNAGPFTPVKNRHFSNHQWEEGQTGIVAYQADAGVIATAKRTIGLARKSIIQIADMLGIVLERVAGGLSGGDIARARSAVASDGQDYQNGFGVRTKSAHEFSIEMINRYPFAHQAKIDSALVQVVSGRIELMQTALASKMGGDIRDAAGAFPYLQVG